MISPRPQPSKALESQAKTHGKFVTRGGHVYPVLAQRVTIYRGQPATNDLQNRRDSQASGENEWRGGWGLVNTKTVFQPRFRSTYFFGSGSLTIFNSSLTM